MLKRLPKEGHFAPNYWRTRWCRTTARMTPTTSSSRGKAARNVATSPALAVAMPCGGAIKAAVPQRQSNALREPARTRGRRQGATTTMEAKLPLAGRARPRRSGQNNVRMPRAAGLHQQASGSASKPRGAPTQPGTHTKPHEKYNKLCMSHPLAQKRLRCACGPLAMVSLLPPPKGRLLHTCVAQAHQAHQ